MVHSMLKSLEGGLIVSCQAPPEDPFYGSENMVKFALAAQQGGAVGIRANSPEHVAAIKARVDLPLIGLWKRSYEDSDIYITPTFEDAEHVSGAGADIVALDATARSRPGGQTLPAIVERMREKFAGLLMADVSTLEEGQWAERIGFDVVSTTLSGYTPYSPQLEGPDVELIRRLADRVRIPVFAEGRIHSPEQAAHCFECGAFALVVGTAITRPQSIANRFVRHIATSRRQRGLHR